MRFVVGGDFIFIDCKRYEEVLREDPELRNIKIIGAYSHGSVQNPVRESYVVIGLSECSVSDGLLSPDCSRRLERKIRLKAYTPEKGAGESCLEILGRICKKLREHFPNEIGALKILKCKYTTAPYAYCAEADLEIHDSYGDDNVLSEVFKEAL